MSEPCEHGRYERHVVAGEGGPGVTIEVCPGGRILSDAEALRAFLFETCGECGGAGRVWDGISSAVANRGDDHHTVVCPTCGGSGQTPKDEVVERIADAVQAWWLSGTDDPDLREWWGTQDAQETASTLAEVVLAAMLEGDETDERPTVRCDGGVRGLGC
jgi:hypothetical protein